MTANTKILRERPILFSAPMVQTLLDGRKTQTRRVVKHPLAAAAKRILSYKGQTEFDCVLSDDSGGIIHCPYGQPGDRLWVREAWAHDAPSLEQCRATHEDLMGGMNHYGPYYRATEPAPYTLKWRPSIHMPRWASRITLEIVSVRVERLQDISEADAKAEGIVPAGDGNGWQLADTRHYMGDPVSSYASIWEYINGPRSWAANPWVWAMEFKKVPA